VALKRVFVNLLDNAIKFSPINTTVSVSLRWIPSISITDNNGFINVVVADQGIGIAMENLGNIFRPFFQIDQTLHREQKGVGLGLALVRQLVDLHQGRISVKSKQGEGTRFDITFPAFSGQTPEQRQRLLMMSVHSPMEIQKQPLLGSVIGDHVQSLRDESVVQAYITPALVQRPFLSSPIPMTHSLVLARFDTTTCIMVVDDNNVNRRLLHRMLSNFGFSNIVEAENGQEALEVVETLMAGKEGAGSGVALMFLDIQMPVLDGPSAAKALRDKGYTFPIIAFSASTFDLTLDSPFNAFLEKPIKTSKLKLMLEHYLSI